MDTVYLAPEISYQHTLHLVIFAIMYLTHTILSRHKEQQTQNIFRKVNLF